jgi:hypothetical protein
MKKNGEPADSEQKGVYTIWKAIKEHTLNKTVPPTTMRTEKKKRQQELIVNEVVEGGEKALEIKDQLGRQERKTKGSEQSILNEHMNEKRTEEEITNHEEQTDEIFNLSDVLVSFDDIGINKTNNNLPDLSPNIDICSNVEIVGSELLLSEPGTSKNPNIFWDKHLHWPQVPSAKIAKRNKEQMPFAITSAKWKEYNDIKDKVKTEKEETVRKRKADREQKKEIIEQEKKKKKENRHKLNKLIEQKNTEIKNKLAEFKKA